MKTLMFLTLAACNSVITDTASDDESYYQQDVRATMVHWPAGTEWQDGNIMISADEAGLDLLTAHWVGGCDTDDSEAVKMFSSDIRWTGGEITSECETVLVVW
jgi:uncharacterized protein YceK